MWIRSAIGAPFFSGAGVVLGVYGTYLVTRQYHPFDKAGFARTVARLLILRITRRGDEADRAIKVAIGLADPEDRWQTLNGVYYVFLGFVAQVVGSLLWLVDAMLPHCISR